MKKIIPIIGAALAATIIIAGCGAKEKPEISTTSSTISTESTSTEAITEATTETITETTTEVSTDTEIATETEIETPKNGDSPLAEEPYTAVQDGRDESAVTNGANQTITAKVGDYIDIEEVIGGSYAVSNIEIKSGDSISVMGKGSVVAEKKGTTVIECSLLDEDTNTKTTDQFTIIII